MKKYQTGHPRRRVWWQDPLPRYEKRIRHCSRPGYGMGLGRNTLIHNGRKPLQR